MLIGHLQDLAASEVLAPFAPASAGDDIRRPGVHRQREDLQAIGPPLQRNNFANLTETCILDEDFVQHVRPIKVHILASTLRRGFGLQIGQAQWISVVQYDRSCRC